jgi:hypothetical protein
MTDVTDRGPAREAGGAIAGRDERPAGDDRAWRRLRLTAVLFGVGSAVHVVDHLRRGQGSVTDELNAAGIVALVFQVVIVTLAVTGHRVAPLWAAAAGLTLAVGFTTAHWLPEWSALSDPVWEVDSLPALTAAASLAEVAGAVAIGLAGLAIVRRDGLASFGTPRPA